MSWNKPPGEQAPPGSAPPQQFGQQPTMYQSYQGAPQPNPQQSYWQQPQLPQQQLDHQQQAPYSNTYCQPHQQQQYPNNANQYQQPAQYNANYNQTHANPQQYQQSYYQNPAAQQQNQKADGWEDNWDWGWDDVSKQSHNFATQNTAQQPTQFQQPVAENANTIEESFVNTDTWNWSMTDNKESAPVKRDQVPATLPVESSATENATSNNISLQATNHDAKVKTLSDKEAVKAHLPNLALGRRPHLENLTPQWSIESQMSQESSDGPQTQSESTYRSENHSRNSTKSSPSFNNIEGTQFNYSLSGNNDFGESRLSTASVEGFPSQSNREVNQDIIANSLRDMTINREIITSEKSKMDSESVRKQSTTSVQNIDFGAPQVPNASPMPSVSSNLPPPSHPPISVLPPPPSSNAGPPITNMASNSSSQNPFKNKGPFSHKNLSKPGQPPNSNLVSPAAVNKISQQNRIPIGFGANLESTPDNSERPDQPHVSMFRTLPAVPQVPDNLEIAPQNDRNEYMQTEQLSSGNYGDNGDYDQNAPPPGFRRMVVGQQESEYGQNLNISGDEPPPGLSRMVPGQQTESDNTYNQTGEDYMDRQIDGQPTEGNTRPYRQADGQQTPGSYSQSSSRVGDRRPIGFDRMVPGEPSNEEYSQYQGGYAGANEQRVVTGLDHDYPELADTSASDVREQNIDGFDYSEPPARNFIGARETVDVPLMQDQQQREIVMEGENLQDLSVISSIELTFSREQTLDGADLNVTDVTDRRADVSDSIENHAPTSRRQSLNRGNSTEEDSERDRSYKSSPRKDKDKDKRKTSREHDRDRDKERKYDSREDRKYDSRDDRKYDRELDRRSGRDDRRSERRDRDRDRDRDRRERDDSPDDRRYRRSTRSRRYDTEDTDYYSDRERERRRHREGSHSGGTAGKPPRPRDRRRREHDGYERRYRDIDPNRVRGDQWAEPMDEGDGRRRSRRSRHTAPRDYYDESASGATLQYSRQQYEYYEHLRRTDPAAYLRVYQQLMAGSAPPVPAHFTSYLDSSYGYGTGYETRTAEPGSVHSGRSSANGLTRTDTSRYGGYARARALDASSLRDAPSLRTDISDRELQTDMSLNLALEESSDRHTPLHHSVAHAKLSVRGGCGRAVLVEAAYPVDGARARVLLLSMRAHSDLPHCPTPCVPGVTHKKSVVEWCISRAREAGRRGAQDAAGYALLWKLLALLLTQNGVAAGADLAELLLENQKDFPENMTVREGNGRSSSTISEAGTDELEKTEDTRGSSVVAGSRMVNAVPNERAALDSLRDLLLVGDRQEAIEHATRCGLWGHALSLAAYADRRTRAAVHAKFLSAMPVTDPLYTLYHSLAARVPPAATSVADARWGDWRPHAAVLLANPSSKPEQDRRTLTQLGDSLLSRGLLFSAQFCYVCGGVGWSTHPAAPLQTQRAHGAPPRLALLLADSRAATLTQLATNEAIIATEIYEYAISLADPQYVLHELQVYKLVMATRLVDAGEEERALRYLECAARGVARDPARHSPAFVTALAELADRLKYCDPSLGEDAPGVDDGLNSGEPSPRHQQWLDDVKLLAGQHQQSISAQSTPQHAAHEYSPAQWPEQQVEQFQQQQQQYGAVPMYAPPTEKHDQSQYEHPVPHYEQPPAPPHNHQLQEPVNEEQQQQTAQQQLQQQQQPQWGEQWQPETAPAPVPQYDYSAWGAHAQAQSSPYVEGEHGAGDGDGSPRPNITMPGTRRAQYDGAPTERDGLSLQSTNKKQESKASEDNNNKNASGEGAAKKSGWLGGLFGRLVRPPNQMILPDDKDPAIVWNETTKRWVNKDSDTQEDSGPPPPPPAQPLGDLPPPPPGGNAFKMQRSRHIKKSYVDVLNPGGGGGARGVPPPPGDLMPPAQAPPTYFVPQPQSGGMYDPTQMSPADDGYSTGI